MALAATKVVIWIELWPIFINFVAVNENFMFNTTDSSNNRTGLYLRNLAQLVLSSGKGWEDISASGGFSGSGPATPYCRLVAVAALTELVRPLYNGGAGVVMAVEKATAFFGTYYIAFFIARALLGRYAAAFAGTDVGTVRLSTFTVYGLGLMAVIGMIENLLPADLTLLRFLPLFVALVLYRGTAYMSVTEGNEFRFLCLAVIAVIVVPLVLFSVLSLIIQ